MKAIKFEISGKTAHFKRPEANSFANFTYGHIPKTALMGILGAISGLKGYSAIMDKKKKKHPEFYEKLKGLSVSIVPLKNDRHDFNGIFRKKIQVYNNSTGFANQKKNQAMNLIVRDQWIEDPKWLVYISQESDVDSDILEKIFSCLLEGESVFIPYLGKNDHPAEISNVEMVNLECVDSEKLDSLFYLEQAVCIDDSLGEEYLYLFEDELPVAFNEHGFYICKRVAKTNLSIKNPKFQIYKDSTSTLFLSFI